MELKDIKKLASLSRIEIGEVEMNEIKDDFDKILAYVDTIANVKIDESVKENNILENIMREDIVTNNPHQYTDDIIANMPETENNYLKVKKIL